MGASRHRDAGKAEAEAPVLQHVFDSYPAIGSLGFENRAKSAWGETVGPRATMELSVDSKRLVDAMRIVEIAATSRADAIWELVRAGNWNEVGVSPTEVVQAVEEREAAAQTIIAPGLALPHAAINWDDDFRVILGRSRNGVDYGAAADVVHLVVLLVVGKNRENLHLKVLADVAELMNDDDFRHRLANADDVEQMRRLLFERAGEQLERRPPPPETPRRSVAVVQHAIGLANSLSAQALLLAIDHCQGVPWEPLHSWPGRLLIITAEGRDPVPLDRADAHLFDLPHASLSRMDRANLGLLLAAANGLVSHEREVVCVTGPRGQALDSIAVTRPAAHFRGVFPGQQKQAAASIRPAVILRVLSLAIELASEGREAHPIGATFVIGDTRQVIRRTQQLVLNPFHGFARRLRNVMDPSLAETIKELALLDGAFTIEADGTVFSAGTYLMAKSRVANLPGGLGARHQAAAAITAETRAMAVTVSQSTGTVTLFEDGGIALTLERATLTRW